MEPDKQPPYNPNYTPAGPNVGAPPPTYGYPPQPAPYAYGNQQQPFGYGNPPAPQPYGYAQPQPPNFGYQPAPQPYEDPEAPKTFTANFNFTEASIRRGFVRKVFMILMVQLAFVTGMVALFTFHNGIKQYVRRDGLWLYALSYVTFLITYIVLICCDKVRRRVPGNFICLAVLTLAIGYMTGMIASFHDTNIVFIALGITVSCCLGIVLFSLNTKYDFTSWVGVVFVIFMVVFMFGIFAILFRSAIMHAVYAGLMALIFMVFLAIDTQMICGGKRHAIDPEEYIYAACQLFLDMIYIFWMILQLLGILNRKD